MAFNKSHHYNKRERIVSHFAHALKHPARVCILEELYLLGPRTVQALTKSHPLSQPTISQHLELLRKAQLVEYKEKYPYTYYSIHSRNFKRAKAYLESYLKKFQWQ